MQYYFLDVTCRNFVIDVQPKNLHTIPNWGWRVFYGPGMVQCMTHRFVTPIPIWNTPIVWSLCDFTTTMERGSWGFSWLKDGIVGRIHQYRSLPFGNV